MLCLPITKAVLISTAVVCFLITAKADVYTLSLSLPFIGLSMLGGECSMGVWTSSCSVSGFAYSSHISWSSTSAPFGNYRDVYATEVVQIAAIVFSVIAAAWSLVAVVVAWSKKPMSWICCGVVLHVIATTFGVLLPLVMAAWTEAYKTQFHGMVFDIGLVKRDYGAGFFIAICGSLLLLVSSFLACAECCMVEGQTTVVDTDCDVRKDTCTQSSRSLVPILRAERSNLVTLSTPRLLLASL